MRTPCLLVRRGAADREIDQVGPRPRAVHAHTSRRSPPAIDRGAVRRHSDGDCIGGKGADDVMESARGGSSGCVGGIGGEALPGAGFAKETERFIAPPGLQWGRRPG